METVTLRIYDPAKRLICQFHHPTEAGRKLYRDLFSNLSYTHYRLVLIGPDGQILEGEVPPTGRRRKK
jgi:hypothetical protein